MKYSKLSILALSAVVTFSACNDKLDLAPSDAQENGVAVNESNVKLLANGLYEKAQELEYYGRDFMVTTDVGGIDMKITGDNSNRFIQEFQYLYLPLVSPQTKTWLNAYRVANQASVIIDKLPTNANTSPYKGEAYFMRALAHLDLTRRYTRPYTGTAVGGGKVDPNAENSGITLITKAAESAPNTLKPKRNTLKETYDFIISDLKQAQQLAPASKPNTQASFRASQQAATALLSRVYVYMGDWTNAVAEASKLIGTYPLWEADGLLAAYTADNPTSEDIFSLRFLTAENRGSNNFGYIYLPKDPASSVQGYGDIRLSDSFMSILDVKDARRSLIKLFNGNNYLIKWQGNGQGFVGMVNVKILRISEVLLNRAEAYAEMKNLTGAVADINTLRAKRGLAPYAGNVTDAAVITEIKQQRRLELVGEGQAMTDLFRKNDVRIINDKDAILPPNMEVKPDNFRVAYPIPQTEVDANANMVQNPGYPK
ncbi:MAG TPA: RagB/SusD family nutrient uptake outer membrane protein [Chitinophaga sp.]|uniref:RagB/SusD family nutrient uptake outer membrane protein n=1 Tax=Chitinophaga sp. TaxID=1869181 RepID=UPI002B60FE01|nr:RagB/SusD family nutrient uptake outer membrane protein [Chitinophaga sp.]HVI43572.1 RagB/SusD family nutrient uptake outer membrane protein [Chitinophaga sp.]